MLSLDQKERICEAALEAGLGGDEQRRLLLRYLPPRITAQLHAYSSPAAQLIGDVNTLSHLSRDGVVDPLEGNRRPIELWLLAALQSTLEKPSRAIFEEMLGVLAAPGRTPRQGEGAGDAGSVTGAAESGTATARHPRRVVDPKTLLAVMMQSIDSDDLEHLCFLLDLRISDLAGQTRRARLISLIRYFSDRQDTSTLVEVLLAERPHLSRRL